MKRIAAVILLICLCFSLVPCAFAENGEKAAADRLYEMGLFKGTGFDEDGEPTYELERQASRTEALVMLIRLLGKEADALAFTGSHPFTDVPSWADSYVAYAYANGLTNGMSDTVFGASTPASANMYLTFVLRALGYDDKGDEPDFSYTEANEFAIDIGLTDTDFSSEEFVRGNAAVVSLSALSQPLADSAVTLIEELVETGAVDAAAAVELIKPVGPPKEGDTFTIPIYTRTYGSYERTEYDADDILAIFPDAYLTIKDSWWTAFERAPHFEGLSSIEYALVRSVATYLNTQLPTNEVPNYDVNFLERGTAYYIQYPMQDFERYIFVADKNINILGYLSVGLSEPELTVTVRHYDTSSIYNEIKDYVNTCVENAADHTLSIDFSTDYGEWFDGEETSAYFPILLDGEPLPSDYHVFSSVYMMSNDTYTLEDGILHFFTSPGFMSGYNWDTIREESDGTTTIYKPVSTVWTHFVMVFDDDLTLQAYLKVPPRNN